MKRAVWGYAVLILYLLFSGRQRVTKGLLMGVGLGRGVARRNLLNIARSAFSYSLSPINNEKYAEKLHARIFASDVVSPVGL